MVQIWNVQVARVIFRASSNVDVDAHVVVGVAANPLTIFQTRQRTISQDCIARGNNAISTNATYDNRNNH